MNLHRLARAAQIYLVLATSHFLFASSYTTFDIPGAVKIYPYAVNNSGQGTGSYTDSSGNYYGFFIQADGSVSKFDTPGTQTVALAINRMGQVTGWYLDGGYASHGFQRSPSGQVTTFDVPGAGRFGTVPTSINDAGQIAGGYFDTNDAAHGFIRDASGRYTFFDIPSIPSATEVANAYLGQSGNIAGTYQSVDSENCNCAHGFVRDTLGNITTFDVPGAISTYVVGVNAGGQITGYYQRSLDNSALPYFRDSAGNITTFAVPGWFGTAGIENNGDVVGAYQGAEYSGFGWLRTPAGKISSFRDPNSGSGFEEGTYAVSVSANGNVAGYFVDSKKKWHGFLMQ